jgi:hypothetical protein
MLEITEKQREIFEIMEKVLNEIIEEL